MPDELMSPQELAEFFVLPVGTIYRWRQHGEGPRGYRVGRHVRYKRTEVETWLETQADPRPAA